MQIIASATIGSTISENHIGAKNENARAATVSALFSQIAYLMPSFYKAGFPKSLATTYALAQMMHESDWMTSSEGNVDNNYAGITWINKPYQKATKGQPKPKADGGGYYAHFNNFGEFAADFLRILSLNTGGQGRPIDATTADQYGQRLKANHYFTDPNYYSKFNSALKKVNAALQYGIAQNKMFTDARAKGENTFTADAEKGVTPGVTHDLADIEARWNGLPTWAKWFAGIAGLLITVKILK